MSTTVDQKVVEMRFDNRQFESNVSTTMSTIDKLKQKLHLTGASKGLEEIDNAAKKVDMNGLARSVETVGSRFSALQVMGVTALANITNSAVNAGKRLVAAFTVDPVKTGFQEYELKMGSIQTIMASTGEKLSTVNEYLEELNKYSDKTIYSFSDMTNNIGKFTNAGVKLEDAVLAIKGISNEAAVSGANANEASRAMYNFSQALSSGYVKLIDWKSIENANMATVEFKEQLIQSAVACGTLTKTADGMYNTGKRVINATHNFNDSLTDQWMTTEVLTRTLANYATDVREMTDAERQAYEEKLRGQGYTDEQIKKIEELGQKAYDSAQDVKTFTMMMDTLKEAAQSGWAKTWELILGDFEQAKKLWTNLSKFFGGLIDKMSDARNNLIESALGKSFSALIERIRSVTSPIKKTAENIKELTKSAEDYSKVVKEIIRGNWGNGWSRWNKLTEAGYDWAHAQNLVNEQLGNSKRHATNYKETQDKLTSSTDKVTDSIIKLSEANKERLRILIRLSDEDLKLLGYTDDTIDSLNELKNTAKKLGMSVDDFIDNIDEIDGRWLLLNAFKNAAKGLLSVFEAVGKAWREIFHGKDTDEQILQKKADAIFDIIAAFHKFSTKLIISEENVDKLTRTFKGLFAILDIVRTIAGSGVSLAFKVLSKVFKLFDINILDFTANIGDMLVQFRDWLFKNNSVVQVIDEIVHRLPGAITAVKEWIEAFMAMPEVQEAINNFSEAFDILVSKIPGAVDALMNWVNAIKELESVQHLMDSLERLFNGIVTGLQNLTGIDFTDSGINIFKGLLKGLASGTVNVIDFIIETASNLINAFCDMLGIHSPSRVFIAIGGFIISGLILGLQQGFITVPDVLTDLGSRMLEAIKTAASKMIEFVKNIQWDKILALGISLSMVFFVAKLANAVDNISELFEGLGTVFYGLGKIAKAKALDITADAIKKMAISLAILVASIVVLAKIGKDNWTDMKNAVITVGVLAVVLALLALAMNKMSAVSASYEKGKGFNINGIKSGLLTIGLAILAMGVAVKMIGSMKTDQYTQGLLGVIALAGVLTLVLAAYGALVKGKTAQNMDKAAKLISKMSISLLLMVFVCKLVAKLRSEEIIKGTVFVTGFVIFVGALTVLSKKYSVRTINKLGGTLIKITIAMGLMVGVIKLIKRLSVSEILKGVVFATGFIAFVKKLALATNLPGEPIPRLGRLVLAISFSMLTMVGVVKLLSSISIVEMLKGITFAIGFLEFTKILVRILTIGNDKQIAKVTLTILAMSVAISVLAGVSILLGLINIKDLIKGVTAVSILGSIMALMLFAARGVNNIAGTVVVLTIAIAGMVAAVAALSMLAKKDPKSLTAAVSALAILMTTFAGVIATLKLIRGNVLTAIAILSFLTIVIGALSYILYKMSELNVQSSIQNAIALSILMTAMSVVALILSRFKGQFWSMAGAIGALTVLAIPMYAFTKVLAEMNNVENSIKNATALGGLMLAMSVVLAIISLAGNSLAGAIFGVVGMLGLAGISWVFVKVLSSMNELKNARENAITLGGLMLAMAAALAIISIVGPLAGAGLIALGGLMILMIAMLALVLVMGECADKIEPLLNSGLPIMIKLAEGIGEMIGKFISGIGEGLGGTFVKIGEDIKSLMTSLKEAAQEAEGINGSAFDGVGALIKSLIGVGFSSAVTTYVDTFTKVFAGVSSMEKFKNDGVAFFDALKEISLHAANIKFPENFSSDAITTLIDAILSVGKISVGITIADVFTKAIGDETAIEKFKEDGKAFFTAIGEISNVMVGFSFPEDFSVNGLTTLLDALESVGNHMIGLSIADMFSRIGGDETAIEKFKEDGKAFFTAIDEISNVMVGFSFPEDFSVEGLNTFLDILKDVGNRMIGLSIADLFAKGDMTAMDKFKTDGVDFFTAIKEISKAMVGFSFPENFSQEGLEKLFSTLKSVSNYTIGASWEDLLTLGGTTIEKFKKDGVDFFTALKTMSTEAASVNMAGFTIAESAISRIKSVITSVSNIDYSGVSEFTGIGTGGIGADGPMHDIAKALKDFGSIVAKIDLESMKVSITAATKLKILISNLNNLDASGVENFKPEAIAKEMSKYSKKVKDIDSGQINSSISSANELVSLIDSLIGIDTSGINLFNVVPIGDKMKSYSDSVASINSVAIQNSIKAADQLRGFITKLVGLNISGVGQFKTAIANLGKIQIDNITKTFRNSATQLTTIGSDLILFIEIGMNAKRSSLSNASASMVGDMINQLRQTSTKFSEVGSILTEKLASGISTNKSVVNNMVTSMMSSSVSSIRTYYTSFYSAGSYLADGLANGITAHNYKAVSAAVQMAYEAKKAMETALGIASPSKVFYKIGDFTGQGFIKALKDYGDESYSTSYEMAEYARKGLSDAISKVQKVIDTDNDYHPTIKPVLDLSDVESGASIIGSLFSSGTTIGMSAHIDSLSSMMNNRNQNGAQDVVSAIESLRNDLDKVGGTTYNSINGINYNDDANVSEAIKTLVRAAKMERRA